MNAPRGIFLLFLLVSRCAAQTSGSRLAFSDEFSGPANTPPDPAKWTYDLGNGPPPGWGNSELENYTSSTDNCFQDGQGHLVLQALLTNGAYTSCRIKTLGRFAFTYGRVEARIRLPYAQGIWPAFWLLPSSPGLIWPAGGEIDIAENFGVQNNDVASIHSTIHGPGYAGTGVTDTYTLPGNAPISAAFHVFAANWSPDRIEFLVDGQSWYVAAPASLPQNGQWVFDDDPMYLLLNLAVGGSPAPVGSPGPATSFPQQMLVDYVRVYQQISIDPTTPNIAPDAVGDAASYAPVAAPGALAALFGSNLSDTTFNGAALFNNATGAFATSTSSGVTVSVNGVNAPLVYVSPTQINFQVPWQTIASPDPAQIQVSRQSLQSPPVPLAITATAPSVFLNPVSGFALVTSCVGGVPSPGATCVLWGNGFGPKNAAQQDGLPAAPAPPALFPLAVPGAPASCQLTIAGQPAVVSYCGAAPGEVIDQLNFTYPANLPGNGSYIDAQLSISGQTGTFTLPVSR